MTLVGVLAVQGDFAKHVEALKRTGLTENSIRLVRVLGDLDGVSHLIIPGGESTTVGLLLDRYGLGSSIKEHVAKGLAVWGTCMGMIMLANQVEGRDQYSLNLLDITVRRNAFGAQIHSFETEIAIQGFEKPAIVAFIRAPIVTAVGSDVETLATFDDQIVAVRQGKILGTSFHPELTEDVRFHRFFLNF